MNHQRKNIFFFLIFYYFYFISHKITLFVYNYYFFFFFLIIFSWPSKSPTRYTTPQKTLNGPSNFVEYSYQLEELCKNLLIEKTLGIAFKTFADHSYQFVCILQISTEDKDYIVDAISLRNQLFLLNDILSNPQICKIVYERNLVLSLMYNLLGLDLVNVYDINQMALRYSMYSNFHIIIIISFGKF